MKYFRGLFISLSAAAAMAAGAVAADFGAMPASYESATESYVSSRLADSRSARIQFVSSPYQVLADFEGYDDVPAWAVDVRVRSRLSNGSMGGYVPYTVIFVDGVPVAFEEDLGRLVRADTSTMYADSR